MRMAVGTVCVFSVLGLIGCTQQDTPQIPLQSASLRGSEDVPWRLVSFSDGSLYELNAETGALYLVKGTNKFQVTNGMITLQVGQSYEMPDAQGDDRYLEYLGGGKFKASAWGAVTELPPANSSSKRTR